MLGYRMAHFGLRDLLHLYREIFVARGYEVDLGRDAPRIIDCGSNIGMAIVYFKHRYPRARVVGFEPHPVVFDTLRANIAGNNMVDVTVHRKALGAERGNIRIYLNSNEPGALDTGMYAKRADTPFVDVECDLLSDYIDGEVDLLKLDIEGAEHAVLAELSMRDRLRRIRHIVCEYHHHLERDQDCLSRTLGIL